MALSFGKRNPIMNIFSTKTSLTTVRPNTSPDDTVRANIKLVNQFITALNASSIQKKYTRSSIDTTAQALKIWFDTATTQKTNALIQENTSLVNKINDEIDRMLTGLNTNLGDEDISTIVEKYKEHIQKSKKTGLPTLIDTLENLFSNGEKNWVATLATINNRERLAYILLQTTTPCPAAPPEAAAEEQTPYSPFPSASHFNEDGLSPEDTKAYEANIAATIAASLGQPRSNTPSPPLDPPPQYHQAITYSPVAPLQSTAPSAPPQNMQDEAEEAELAAVLAASLIDR